MLDQQQIIGLSIIAIFVFIHYLQNNCNYQDFVPVTKNNSNNTAFTVASNNAVNTAIDGMILSSHFIVNPFITSSAPVLPTGSAGPLSSAQVTAYQNALGKNLTSAQIDGTLLLPPLPLTLGASQISSLMTLFPSGIVNNLLQSIQITSVMSNANLSLNNAAAEIAAASAQLASASANTASASTSSSTAMSAAVTASGQLVNAAAQLLTATNSSSLAQANSAITKIQADIATASSHLQNPNTLSNYNILLSDVNTTGSDIAGGLTAINSALPSISSASTTASTMNTNANIALTNASKAATSASTAAKYAASASDNIQTAITTTSGVIASLTATLSTISSANPQYSLLAAQLAKANTSYTVASKLSDTASSIINAANNLYSQLPSFQSVISAITTSASNINDSANSLYTSAQALKTNIGTTLPNINSSLSSQVNVYNPCKAITNPVTLANCLSANKLVGTAYYSSANCASRQSGYGASITASNIQDILACGCTWKSTYGTKYPQYNWTGAPGAGVMVCGPSGPIISAAQGTSIASIMTTHGSLPVNTLAALTTQIVDNPSVTTKMINDIVSLLTPTVMSLTSPQQNLLFGVFFANPNLSLSSFPYALSIVASTPTLTASGLLTSINKSQSSGFYPYNTSTKYPTPATATSSFRVR